MNKKNSVARLSIIVTGITILIKVIGLAKQVVVAWAFGSNGATDCYFLAEGFVVPITNVVFSSISIMLLSEYVYEKNKKEKNELISNMIVVYICISLIISCLIILMAPFISRVIALGYSEENIKVISKYMIMLTFVLPFFCIASIHGAVLQGEKKFAQVKSQGGYISVSIIVWCVLFSKQFGIKAVIYGTVMGYVIYMVVNYIYASRYVQFTPRKPFHDIRVRKVIKLGIPLMLGGAVDSIQAIIDKSIASNIGEGAVSNLNYAQIVSNDLISGLFVLSVGSVFYSYFTEYISNKNIEAFKNIFIKGLNVLIVILFCLTIVYFFWTKSMLNTVFAHGSFNEKNVNETCEIVYGYAVGFILLAFRDFHIKAHYAFQDSKTPMINGLIGVVCNFVFSIVLSKYFGGIGIALGTSISYAIISILSVISLRKHIYIPYRSINITMFKSLIASIVCSLFFIICRCFLDVNMIFVWVICCLIGIFIYFVTLLLLKTEAMVEIKETIFKKIGRS